MNPSVLVATGGLKDGKHMTSQLVPTIGSEMNVDSEPASSPRPLTRLQERLLKKLGSNAFPFYFQLPPDAPASVMLQPGPNENGKPCGVNYELRTYVADVSDDKLPKRNSVRLAIRKLTYAPEEPAPQPSAVVVKDFIMSPGSLRLEVSLDKEKYYHSESIAVNVLVDNNSNKTVKKIKLSICQEIETHRKSRQHSTCTIADLDTHHTGWCKVYRLRPLLTNNRQKRGLALDGKLKHEDTNLASSTIICNPQQKEALGIIVQYCVKVRLVLGFGSSDISLELPFTLTHPKPVEDSEEEALQFHDIEEIHSTHAPLDLATSPPLPAYSPPDKTDGELIAITDGLIAFSTLEREEPQELSLVPVVSHQTETPQKDDDDDLVFEDFARLRLKANDPDAVLPPFNAETSMASGDCPL